MHPSWDPDFDQITIQGVTINEWVNETHVHVRLFFLIEQEIGSNEFKVTLSLFACAPLFCYHI